MPLELYISRRAAREILRVVQWWSLNRPAAPGAVRLDLQAALDLLLVQPDSGSRVMQASSPEVRRFYLDRIRYWVYYRGRAIASRFFPSGMQIVVKGLPSRQRPGSGINPALPPAPTETP